MFHYRIPHKEDLPVDQGQNYLDMNAIALSVSNCEVLTKVIIHTWLQFQNCLQKWSKFSKYFYVSILNFNNLKLILNFLLTNHPFTILQKKTF